MKVLIINSLELTAVYPIHNIIKLLYDAEEKELFIISESDIISKYSTIPKWQFEHLLIWMSDRKNKQDVFTITLKDDEE